MIVRWYHGGPRIADWNHVRWDRDRSQSDLNAEGPGVYWTTDPDEAWGYAHGASDPVVYEATMRDSFKLLPKRKPTLKSLQDLYDYATHEDQETFLSNWSIEMPASQPQINQALKPYTGQDTLFDAYVTLYHDLFMYDADAYVAAMQSLGFDGYIVDRTQTGSSKKKKHLILYRPRAMEIQTIS